MKCAKERKKRQRKKSAKEARISIIQRYSEAQMRGIGRREGGQEVQRASIHIKPSQLRAQCM